MDDAEEWTVFAPIARLESLDELDQVRFFNAFHIDNVLL